MRIMLVVLVAIFLNCQQSKRINKSNLVGINLLVDWEFIDGETARIFHFKTDVDLIYYDSLVMLRERITYLGLGKRETYERNDTGFNIQELVRDSTNEISRVLFFIYKPRDTSGLKYDSLGAKTGVSFNVDSLIKDKIVRNDVFYIPNDSLVETVNHVEGYSMLKKYVPKIKYDDSYADSSYLYFSDKLRDIKHSFSPLLDSIEKMKLCKVIFVYNSIPKGKYDKDMPRRQMLFEIKKIDIDEPEKIIALFEQFKRNISKSIDSQLKSPKQS